MVHGHDGSKLMGTRHNTWLIGVLIAMFAVSTGVCAQQIVYPAKGQSAGQQKKDEGECGKWAVDKTGFDPAKPATTTAAPAAATTATGTTPGAGARGAARGAVVGGMMGDAGAGAAAGAVAARGQSRRQNAAQQQQATQQQQQVDSAQKGAYLKARAACLEGRGYTVK
jgi:hypothetical protein